MEIVEEYVEEKEAENKEKESLNAGDKYEKGNLGKLLDVIQLKIIGETECASMKMLTDIIGYDGNDKKKRHCVKNIIERMFLDKLTFIKILNEPQVAVKAGAQDRGEMLHRKNKTA